MRKPDGQHFRHALVHLGVVIGEGPSLLDACKDARERGYTPQQIVVEAQYREYEVHKHRVVLASDGRWRLLEA